MKKSRNNRKTFIKRITKTTNEALPIVDKELTTIGDTAKNIAKISIPIVKKGVSTIYGTMATGFDMGVKGVKNISKKKYPKHHRKKTNKTKLNTKY